MIIELVRVKYQSKESELFGSGVKKREQERKDIEKLATREGYALVPVDEYKEFIAWKNQKKGKKK